MVNLVSLLRQNVCVCVCVDRARVNEHWTLYVISKMLIRYLGIDFNPSGCCGCVMSIMGVCVCVWMSYFGKVFAFENILLLLALEWERGRQREYDWKNRRATQQTLTEKSAVHTPDYIHYREEWIDWKKNLQTDPKRRVAKLSQWLHVIYCTNIIYSTPWFSMWFRHCRTMCVSVFCRCFSLFTIWNMGNGCRRDSKRQKLCKSGQNIVYMLWHQQYHLTINQFLWVCPSALAHLLSPNKNRIYRHDRRIRLLHSSECLWLIEMKKHKQAHSSVKQSAK